MQEQINSKIHNKQNSPFVCAVKSW